MLQGKASLDKYSEYLLPAIVFLVLAVYFPVYGHDFINYDDPSFVIANPYIQAGVTVPGIVWAFSSGHEANWIPLTWISHMFDIQLFGLNPAGHHIVSLLLHLGSTVLLYRFFRTTTGAPWQSAAVALLFALHPIHVESVAWVAERKDVLSCFFWMLTLCAYARYRNNPGITAYLIVVSFFTLGLLAKPMLVTLPFVLLLLDRWPLKRLGATDVDKPPGTDGILRLVGEKIPFFLLSAGSSVITYLTQHQAGTVYQSYLPHARVTRALTSYVAYLHKTFWPAKLAVIYPFSKYPPSAAHIAFSALTLMAITALALWLKDRHPYLATGWFWYIISLLPVIGLVQIGEHSVADRYTYIPLVGIFVALAWGLPLLAGAWRYRTVALGALIAAAVCAMTALTVNNLSHWQNSVTLFSHALEVTEENWVAHNNLGLALLDQGQTDEAIEHFRDAIKVKPSYATAYLNLGFAHRTKGELLPALRAFNNALMFEPGNEKAHLGLGLLYLELGNRDLALAQYATLKAAGSAYAPPLMQEIVNAWQPLNVQAREKRS